MKHIKLLLVLLFAVCICHAQTAVGGYYRKNGTYVKGHVKTTRNKTNRDNYSTIPNTNPFTGKRGYKRQDYTPSTNNNRTLYTGSRGGQYYINNKGKKVYVPKN